MPYPQEDETGLVGPIGPAGKDGKNGADGNPGADGKSGEKGKDGTIIAPELILPESYLYRKNTENKLEIAKKERRQVLIAPSLLLDR